MTKLNLGAADEVFFFCQTFEQSWIPHATLLDVNVEVLAKHYPKLLGETFNFKLVGDDENEIGSICRNCKCY